MCRGNYCLDVKQYCRSLGFNEAAAHVPRKLRAPSPQAGSQIALQ